MTNTDVRQVVKDYVEEELLDGEAVGEDARLFGDGLIDSMNLVQLLGFIEAEFEIKVPTSAVNIENLDTLGAIAGLVEGLRR